MTQIREMREQKLETGYIRIHGLYNLHSSFLRLRDTNLWRTNLIVISSRTSECTSQCFSVVVGMG